MYNGIGLQTPRGSGTNGYVQRNWAYVKKTKEKVHYKTEEELEKLEAGSKKEPNQEILDHERKRKMEIKCIELEEVLQNQGYSKEEIKDKVASYRSMLMDSSSGKKLEVPRDEFGRVKGELSDCSSDTNKNCTDLGSEVLLKDNYESKPERRVDRQ